MFSRLSSFLIWLDRILKVEFDGDISFQQSSPGLIVSFLVNFCSNFSFLVLNYSPRYENEVVCLLVVLDGVLVEILDLSRFVENFVFVGMHPS